MSRRIRLRKPSFTNIRVTEEQARYIKNQRYQSNEPVDSAMQRILEKAIKYDKEHPEKAVKGVLHYTDDRMSGLLLGQSESIEAETVYDWMRYVVKYEKELELDAGDNPYQIIQNLRTVVDKYRQLALDLQK